MSAGGFVGGAPHVECDTCGAGFFHAEAGRVVGMQCAVARCPGHYRLTEQPMAPKGAGK